LYSLLSAFLKDRSVILHLCSKPATLIWKAIWYQQQ
jgi:hypothetical protein